MSASAGPVVIGGLSFCGKTPVRMILGAHPAMSMTRGTRMWDRYWGRFGDLRDPGALDRCLAAMAQDSGVGMLAPDFARVREDFLAGPPTYGALFAVVHGHAARRAGKPRWGDQLKRVERFADPLLAELPDARMLHLLRDPRDRVAAMSASRPRRIGRLGWETAQSEASARIAARNERRYPGRYLVVPYEALVADPEATIASICRFVGEEFVAPMHEVLARCRPRAATDARRGTTARLGLADRFSHVAWSVVAARGARQVPSGIGAR